MRSPIKQKRYSSKAVRAVANACARSASKLISDGQVSCDTLVGKGELSQVTLGCFWAVSQEGLSSGGPLIDFSHYGPIQDPTCEAPVGKLLIGVRRSFASSSAVSGRVAH